MFERWITRKHDCARLAASSLRAHLLSFASQMESEGYAPRTLRRYLFAGEAFGAWLGQQRCSVEGLDESIFVAYVESLGRQTAAGRAGGRLPNAASGVRKLAALLYAQMPAASRTDGLHGSGAACIRAFDRHLGDVAGLAGGTRSAYCRFARAMTAARFGTAEADWRLLDAAFVTEFVREQAERSTGSGCRGPVTATRAFLRFLIGQGQVDASLIGAVPTVRRWKHAALPDQLSAEQVRAVIASCSSASPVGRRDRAIVETLAGLALRAGEVAALRLDDIRWVDGTLVVRGAKSRRERILPLPAAVATAIVAYLRDGRPRTKSRQVFLHVRAPHGALTASGVSTISACALRRAGVRVARMGAHVLRHTAATRMVRGGASFKQIADVLGHARIETTAIYAKLDLAALARVALPWPGAQP